MKKAILLTLLTTTLAFPLTSCGSHKGQKNCFMEGEFSAKNEEKETEMVYFDVKEITKAKYEESNGINTVYDVVIKKYFALSLYITEEGSNEKESIVFKNMKKVRTDDVFCIYEDDNSNHIRPHVMHYENKEFYETHCSPIYTIYQKKNSEGLSRYGVLFDSAVKDDSGKELVV